MEIGGGKFRQVADTSVCSEDNEQNLGRNADDDDSELIDLMTRLFEEGEVMRMKE